MKPFLITSNVKGVVDENVNPMYLGVWASDTNMQDNTLPYIWNSGIKNLHAAQKCEIYYEYFLEILTKELNDIHQISQTKHYYRIILGNWLLNYIHVSFDRFMSIYIFQKRYGDFETILLSNEEYFVPYNFFDFSSHVKCDPYNYQIYTNVIRFLYPSKKFKSVKLDPIQHIKKSAHVKKIILVEKLFLMLNKILNRMRKETILITSPYFGENGVLKMIKLILKSKFQIIYDDMIQDYTFNKKPEDSFRKMIPISSSNRFKKYIGAHILKDLPLIYLEEFREFRFSVNKRFPRKTPSILYTSTGMQVNDVAKFYVAEQINSKMKVITNQHGASYGTSEFHVAERYERSVSDYFFTSGWSENKNTVPFGIPKLCKNPEIKNNIENITYITTYQPKYSIRFDIYPNSGYYHTVYFERMRKFINSYNRTIESHIQIKSYPHEVCFARITEILENIHSDIDIIYTRKLSEIFDESKLIVMDHMGTSMLEAIALNKPIIMVLDPNIELFREDAQPFMRALEGVEIVHYSIHEAIKHIQNIESNVGLWWFSTEVQQVVDSFRNNYAKCDQHWADSLIKQFKAIGSH